MTDEILIMSIKPGKIYMFELSEKDTQEVHVGYAHINCREFLGFVETPLQWVVLTKMDRRFFVRRCKFKKRDIQDAAVKAVYYQRVCEVCAGKR